MILNSFWEMVLELSIEGKVETGIGEERVEQIVQEQEHGTPV